MFDKIWFDGSTVRLLWRDGADGAQDRHDWEHDAPPTGEFRDAFQAFTPFAIALLGLPSEWLDSKVRSLSIKKEEKTNARGLQVTIMRNLASAKNRPVTITTPYLSEPSPEYNGDGQGYLDGVTLQLLDEVQTQAAAYKNGEHGGQQTLKLEESENSKAFDERAAAAETQSTRKPKGRRNQPRQAETGVAIIANPEAAGEFPFTNDQLRQLLLQAERDVPVDAIAQFTSSERLSAEAWARARVREMLGTLREQTVPREPPCVISFATLPLKADGWMSPDAPPKLSEEAVQEINVAKDADAHAAD